MKLEMKNITSIEEIEQLYRVLKEIWEEVFTPIIGASQVSYMMKHYQSVENITEEIDNGVRYCLLIFNNQIVGYTAYQLEIEKVYLSKLYISSAFRGKGLMSEIFDWYEQLALGKTLYLNVNQGNTLAISIYEHRGFKCTGERYVEIGDGYIMNDFIFEKTVKN